MRNGFMAVAVAASMASGTMTAAQMHKAPASTAAIAAALANPARTDHAGDDARRKAAEAVAFSGVASGDIVVDFIPGQSYWTRIFAGVVGPKGHVYAVWPRGAAKYAVEEKPALEAHKLANVTAQADSAIITLPQKADIVWTVQNYHDIPNQGGEASIAAVNAAVFDALKPGGTYVVIDHADAAGKGLADTGTLHRIDPAAVKAGVVKAGFVFVGESTALRNTADDHSRAVFDPAIRGHTDQFMLKFRKPG